MLQLALCDDDPVQIEYLRTLIHKWAAQQGITHSISAYSSAENYLFSCSGEAPADILLLDIQMPGIDGIQLARQIRSTNEAMQILFVTGYPDFMAEGYDVSALHYLMKPVDENKLFLILDRALTRLNIQEAPLLAETDNGVAQIPLRDILYLEAFAHCVSIHTTADVIESRTGIGQLERTLGPSFTRCHRSYLAGLRHISRVTRTGVLLDNGSTIPLSRRLYRDVNQAFIAYYKGE